MSHPPRTVSLFWSKDGHLRLATMRDASGRCLQPYTDFLDSAAEDYRDAEQQAARSAIDACTYAIFSLAIFLTNRPAPLRVSDIDDGMLREFRSFAFEAVKTNKKSRGFEPQMRNTVNIKLRWVYLFLNWCQKNNSSPLKTIGRTNCKVTSSLPSIDSEDNPSDFILSQKQKFPLLYERDGESNKNPGMGQHWATEEEIEKLEDIFWEHDVCIAVRNSLMLRILQIQGWRIGSANSLECEQFSPEAFERSANHTNFLIAPRHQKRGQSKQFEMPWALANRVREYINDEFSGRAAIMSRLRSRKQTTTSSRLFLSVKSGSGIVTSSWSTIFSDAFKRLSAPKGAAAHALRRGAGQSRADQIIEALHEAGQPVTEAAVTPELMQYLGHSSKQSQASYFRAQRRRRGRSRVEKLAEAAEQHALENDSLKAEIARLKAENESLRQAPASRNHTQRHRVKKRT